MTASKGTTKLGDWSKLSGNDIDSFTTIVPIFDAYNFDESMRFQFPLESDSSYHPSKI